MTTSLFQRFITAISGRKCTRYEALISAEADGVATPAELTEMAAHLGACKSCQAHRAIVQASHSVLTSRPHKDVPDELSWRLLNALAAEQATEKNIKRGGGIGSPVFLRPQYVGVFAAVVLGAAVFGIFWKNHSNGPANQIAVKPPVSSHTDTQVAVLPKTNRPISIARHLTASKPVVPAPSESEIASQPVEFVHVRAHTASHLNFSHQNEPSEVASLPTAPKPELGNTPSHPMKRSVISAPHETTIAKVNTPVLPVKAPNMPADHNPVTAPSQVAENLPTVSTPVAVAVAAVEPATIDGHSHLMREMQRLAQRTQKSHGATVSLAAATIRPTYSNAVEMVGSSFR